MQSYASRLWAGFVKLRGSVLLAGVVGAFLIIAPVLMVRAVWLDSAESPKN